MNLGLMKKHLLPGGSNILGNILVGVSSTFIQFNCNLEIKVSSRRVCVLSSCFCAEHQKGRIYV